MQPILRVENVSKTFVLHQQNGVAPAGAAERLAGGERRRMRGAARPLRQRKIDPAALAVRQLFPADSGHICIRHNDGDEWVDLVQAPARKVLEVRRDTDRLGQPVSAGDPADPAAGRGHAAAAGARRAARARCEQRRPRAC